MGSPQKIRKLTLAPLVAATYFMVSGGPYGLEELVANQGYQGAIWILLLTPVIWSLPTALMVGELAGAISEEGGYYVWVRRALGPFWGFQEAWLSFVASIFDMAIYPTLFVLYLGRLFPAVASGTPALALGTAMIFACALWNLRGCAAVGRSSVLMGTAMLGPFLLIVLLSGMHAKGAAPPVPAAGWLAGIMVAMWNYMGWDNASTIASEVDRPERTYPLAMLVSVALIAASYILPVWGAQRAGLDPSRWSTGAWVTAGAEIGGHWLAIAIVIGGIVSAVATFNSLVMSYSRLPAALADDGLLPRIFARRDSMTRAPTFAIAFCAAAYMCCLTLGFSRLVLLDVLLYGASLVLEFIALAVLRIREPELRREFRVPGGLAGTVAIGVIPTALLVAALFSLLANDGAKLALGLAPVLAFIGPLLYLFRRRPAAAV
jgi:amino acid transporter